MPISGCGGSSMWRSGGGHWKRSRQCCWPSSTPTRPSSATVTRRCSGSCARSSVGPSRNAGSAPRSAAWWRSTHRSARRCSKRGLRLPMWRRSPGRSPILAAAVSRALCSARCSPRPSGWGPRFRTAARTVAGSTIQASKVSTPTSRKTKCAPVSGRRAAARWHVSGELRHRSQPGGVRPLPRGRVRSRLDGNGRDSRRPASPSLMPRTQAQRAADAVTAIFQRAAAAPPGSKRPNRWATCMSTGTPSSDWMIEHGLFPERAVDLRRPDPSVSKLRCETDDGVLIDPDTVLQVLLHGYVRFVIHDDEGVPIHWGRERRLFTGAAREAVMSLSHRCTHPGCSVGSSRSEADHRTPWSDGGTTDPHNGGPRCRRHNRLRNHGFTVHRDRHGHWHTYRPDGTEI